VDTRFARFVQSSGLAREVSIMSDTRGRPTRRDALVMFGAGGALGAVRPQPAQPAEPLESRAVERNDAAAARLIAAQVTDPSSSHAGSIPDEHGLHQPASAAGVIETLSAGFLHPRSRLHRDSSVLERIRLAARFLERSQSPQGNIDLLISNFNSPPDTAFVVHGVATAAAIGRRHGSGELVELLRPFLTKAGGGMAAGGVHTPNHRWVVCSALAQVHELFPDPRYVRRIDQWLAEGIDIDADGQFTERSTLTYNTVVTRALVVMAAKLKRRELLEPVRQNLRSLMYLLHGDGEVVSEISRRQDQYTRGGVEGYWFPLTYLAIADGNGQLSAMAGEAAANGARLSALLEYPELSAPLPAPAALPDDFERSFPEVGIVRVRRGSLSATLMMGGSSRLLTLRHRGAVMEGVRFATSFFGKAQFVPDAAEKRGGTYHLVQSLEAPYYQPLAQAITTKTWAATRAQRTQSEICRLRQSAEITETARGFRVRVQASGTDGVPLAVEIGFREGGQLDGCREVPGSPGSFLLEQGTGTYSAGGGRIRFGPGSAPHRYVQLRGAEPKLPALSVYVTGYTPFDRTLTFECL
jgi:hypothetical protein